MIDLTREEYVELSYLVKAERDKYLSKASDEDRARTQRIYAQEATWLNTLHQKLTTHLEATK